MKKVIVHFMVIFLLFFIVNTGSALTDNSNTDADTDLKQELRDLKNKVADLESRIGQNENQDNKLLQVLSGLELGGGLSAGYFYASNPGEDTSDNEFLLSNLLVEISSKDKTLPVGFVVAFGETTTPSLLCTPDNDYDFDIEYASLTLNLITDMGLEVGLLQPNAGYENTYTFNNKNVILGAVASQQPYNAYGARLGYDIGGLNLYGGYYKGRLDNEEFKADGLDCEGKESNWPDTNDSWEIGISGSVLENDFSLYHYNLVNRRNLTGAVIERTIQDIDIAFNIDYWHWDSEMKDFYKSKSAIGGAAYVCPHFGNFSIPVRLEYIDQNESRIYIDSTDAEHIYTATISPTYNFNEKTYIRAESAYVKADGAFADKDGDSKDKRFNLAVEVGYLF